MANNENVENNGRYKVVIVGTGSIGLTAALTLVNDGYNVVVIARNMPRDQSTEWGSPK